MASYPLAAIAKFLIPLLAPIHTMHFNLCLAIYQTAPICLRVKDSTINPLPPKPHYVFIGNQTLRFPRVLSPSITARVPSHIVPSRYSSTLAHLRCWSSFSIIAARLNAPTGLKKPSSATVEALPYPAKRLSRVQEVQEWTEDPSSGGVPDSSQYPQAEGGMRSAARSSSTKNIPGKFPPGSTLSDPLLQWGDGEQASNTIEEHSMALDSNSKHGDGSSEPPQEPVTPAFTVSKDAAGVSVRSLGGRPGIHSLASSVSKQCFRFVSNAFASSGCRVEIYLTF